MSGNRRTTTEEERDVEELLKATEDELLLDLSVGSHISKLKPDYIDSDLNQRFQALKSKKPSAAAASSSSAASSKPISSSSNPIPPPSEKSMDDADDLLARFAALKGLGHSSSGIKIGGSGNELAGDADEEDEVEKIIQWAKDAARLDPSPPTDSDDSDNFRPADAEDGSDYDSEEEEEKKQVHKKKPSRKRGLLGIRR